MRILVYRFITWSLLFFAALWIEGCGSFVARQMVQAPNTYPSWLAPRARVLLSFEDACLTNFPAHFANVGPPPAQLHYRIVNPAEYHLEVTSTNWLEAGKRRFEFNFRADLPGQTNAWTTAPCGTVLLLHGYGLAEFAMAPWALRLAQAGWRCVLIEVRGHGKSSGRKIYFGVKETRDMSQLLDSLADNGWLSPPVVGFGESYGAALALRWQTIDPRVASVVAIAPYAVLSNAVLNLCHEYARLLPPPLIRAGLKRLPAVLNVPPDDLDTTTILERNPVAALFVAGTEDKITPQTDVRELFLRAKPGSEMIVLPGATHETVPYHFSELISPVLLWLKRAAGTR